MIVFEVGFPVVVYNCSFEIGKNADVIHGFFSAFFMNAIIGEKRSANRMQPVEFIIDAEPGLVSMDNTRFNYLLFNRFS
jgi:hypothetical protein